MVIIGQDKSHEVSTLPSENWQVKSHTESEPIVDIYPQGSYNPIPCSKKVCFPKVPHHYFGIKHNVEPRNLLLQLITPKNLPFLWPGECSTSHKQFLQAQNMIQE